MKKRSILILVIIAIIAIIILCVIFIGKNIKQPILEECSKADVNKELYDEEISNQKTTEPENNIEESTFLNEEEKTQNQRKDTEIKKEITDEEVQDTEIEKETTGEEVQDTETKKETIDEEAQDKEIEKETTSEEVQDAETEKENINKEVQDTETEKENINKEAQDTETEKETIDKEVQDTETEKEIIDKEVQNTETEKETIDKEVQDTETEKEIIDKEVQDTEIENETVDKEVEDKELENEQENSKDKVKILVISDTLKGKNKKELEGYENYVGDFIKINKNTLEKIGLDYDGEYYINLTTGEIYDINGEEINGVTYHTIEQYNQIINSEDINKTKELMNIKQQEIQKINSLQFDNGAYASYSKRSNSTSKINPYFDCIGAIGLMNDITSLDNIKKYIEWHFKHINITEDVDGNIGTIYDYDITNEGIETFDEDNLYDSIDSYASMFFVLLDKYYEKTGDKTIFIENFDKLQKVEYALNEMFDSNLNLTIAKPQYPVYYLMDNCESYAGYVSLSNIYQNIFFNEEKSQFYKSRAQLIKNSINTNLWNEDETSSQFSNYDYAYSNSSYKGLFVNRKYYPYVLAQIYPVLHNVVDVNDDIEKSQHLYFLHQYYSDWSGDGQHFWYTFNHDSDKYPHFGSLVVSLMYNNKKFNTKIDGYNIDIDYDIEQAINVIRNNYKTNNFNYYMCINERGYLIRAIDMYMNK